MVIDCCFSLTNLLHGITKKLHTGRRKFIVNDTIEELCAQQIVEGQTSKDLLHENSLTIQCTGTFMLISEPVLSVHQEPRTTDPSTEILKVMHEKNIHTDMQIEVGDKTFRAHRAVLASRSSVFLKMFESDMKEKEERRVIISNIDPEVVSDLLTYIYTGGAPQMKSHVEDLLLAADKYNIPDLVTLCEDELRRNLTPTNVAEVLLLADSLQLGSSNSLKESCIHFISKNSAQVYKSESWKKLKDFSLELAMTVAEAAVLET